MVQLWTEESFVLSHEGEDDLNAFENNFKCLKTLFKGASFGLSTQDASGHPWYHTDTPILGGPSPPPNPAAPGLLKIRKWDNNGWLGVLALAQESDNGLVWFHGDDLSNQEGWVIDTKITEDRVMALKNHGSGIYDTGRTGASDVTGMVGSWEVSGLASLDDEHSHSMGNHNHTLRDSGVNYNTDDGGDRIVAGTGTGQTGRLTLQRSGSKDTYPKMARTDGPSSSDSDPDTHNHTIEQDGDWRIRAQVGVVIYPDI
jgi:hypothetical protein